MDEQRGWSYFQVRLFASDSFSGINPRHPACPLSHAVAKLISIGAASARICRTRIGIADLQADAALTTLVIAEPSRKAVSRRVA